MKTLAKTLATTIGVAAAATVGAVAVGLTTTVATAPVQIQPVVFDAPLPLDPATADAPSTGEILSMLSELADPNIPTANKSYLIEGGVGGLEATVADKKLQKAAAEGKLPLNFDISNVAPSGPGQAGADVTVSSPKVNPVGMHVTFINQGNWKLSRDSALTIMQAAKAR